MAAYIFKTLTGEFKGLDSDGVAAVFNDMLARPGYMTFWMVLVVLLSFFICSLGLQKGVERITKAMMSCLFLILLAGGVFALLTLRNGPGRTGCQCGRRWNHSAGGSFGQ